MSNLTKKFVAIATTLTVSVMLVGPGAAQGATVEELQAMIAKLTADLAKLTADLNALQGGGGITGCGITSFAANLAEGASGADVKCLQIILNSDASTQVASAGAGSSGNETTFFGPLTKAAVVKFQEKNTAEILTPVGLTAGTGFVGPSTRAKLNSLLAVPSPSPPPSPTTGKEGTLAVTAAATPPTAENVFVGQTDVTVSGLNVKAIGSDIKLNRLDINFTTRPWLNVSTLTIADGDTIVKSFEVTQSGTIEVTAGATYLVRVTDLNIDIPNNTTKTIKIKVTPKLVVGDTTETITYQIPANGLRGTDGVAIAQYAPSAALTARTFTVLSSTGALALSVNASNPVERAVIGTVTAITEGVELLRFNLKATINSIIVTTINIPAIDDGQDTLQTLKLYDGDTLLAATSAVSQATNTFAALNLTIPVNTTKTLSVKADLEMVSEARQNGSTSVSVAPTGDSIVAQDASTFATVTPSGSTATGKRIHVYTIAPQLALVSTSIASNRAGRADASNTISADAKIKFSVTALGGDIYISTTSDATITAGVAATTTVTNSVRTTLASSRSTDAETSGNFIVRQGETKSFEVTGFITNASPTNSFVYMDFASFTWGTTSNLAGTYAWSWDSIPLTFKTSSVFLQAAN